MDEGARHWWTEQGFLTFGRNTGWRGVPGDWEAVVPTIWKPPIARSPGTGDYYD